MRGVGMAHNREIKSTALRSLYDRHFKDNPERVESLREEMLKAEVARNLYNLRKELGLSQEQLAERTGIDVSVICDLEEADYEGDALEALRNLVKALGKRVVVDYLERQSPRPPRRSIHSDDMGTLPDADAFPEVGIHIQ